MKTQNVQLVAQIIVPVSIFIHPDRLRFPSPGLLGGEPGRTNIVELNGQNLAPDGALATGEVVLKTDEDRFTSYIAGGGGYGPFEQRDPALVQRDIEYGYVSPEGWAIGRSAGS